MDAREEVGVPSDLKLVEARRAAHQYSLLQKNSDAFMMNPNSLRSFWLSCEPE